MLLINGQSLDLLVELANVSDLMSALDLSNLSNLTKLTNVSNLAYSSHLLHPLSMSLAEVMNIVLIRDWLLVHGIQLVYLSDIHLISCYLSSRLTRLICNSLCLSLSLGLSCLVGHSTNLAHNGVDILRVVR